MKLTAGLALIWALNLPVCAAAVCNLPHLQGTYGFLLYGETKISGNAQPFTNLGRIALDGNGGINGSSSAMLAGFLLGNPVTGDYEVHADCTISWRLQDDSGAYQQFSGVITPDGRNVQFLQTDPGSTEKGTMARTPDGCTAANLQKQYAFTLSGSSTPMLPGERSKTIAAQGRMGMDENGNFKLTLDRSRATADVELTVDSDCTLHLDFSLPVAEGETSTPMTLRGILIDDGKGILAIQTDPGFMVSARFAPIANQPVRQ